MDPPQPGVNQVPERRIDSLRSTHLKVSTVSAAGAGGAASGAVPEKYMPAFKNACRSDPFRSVPVRITQNETRGNKNETPRNHPNKGVISTTPPLKCRTRQDQPTLRRLI
jgi:hypothetical protein